LIGRLPKIDLERLRSEIQATHPHRDDFDSPSVAAMQDLEPIHAELLRCVLAFFSLRSEKVSEAGMARWANTHMCAAIGFNRQPGCDMIANQTCAMRAKRRYNGDLR
jgi:hypothetical protein